MHRILIVDLVNRLTSMILTHVVWMQSIGHRMLFTQSPICVILICIFLLPIVIIFAVTAMVISPKRLFFVFPPRLGVSVPWMIRLPAMLWFSTRT